MKSYKYLTYIIFLSSIQIVAEDKINEYKIEILIYEYKETSTTEEFKTLYEPPFNNHIRFYDDEMNDRSSNFSNISNYIDAIIDNNLKEAENLYPTIWFRDSDDIVKLKDLRDNLKKDKDINFLKSKSWIQTIPDLKSDENLMYMDDEIGFVTKFYKKRFMHLEMDAFLNKNNNDINKYISINQRIFNDGVYLFDHPYFGVVISINEI
jgi:hypothetical protein